MSGLLDNTNKRIGFLCFDLIAGETLGPVTIRVKGEDATLLSEVSAIAKLKVRLHGTSDPYVDVAASPLDLGGFTPGSDVDLDLACEAQAVTGLERDGIFIGTVTSGPAAWAA